MKHLVPPIMNTRLLFFLALFLFCSAPALAYDGLVTLGFGDSITLGYPYLTGYGNGCNCGMYEKFLEQRLTASGHPNLVFNWGVGGESTAAGMNRIESNIQTAIYHWGHVDFVLLMEGTNDFNYGFSRNTTIFNLSVMIDKIRKYHIVPILGTLTPDTSTPAKNIPAYNIGIQSIAQTKHVILVDHYAAMVANWSALNYDGLHPNATGYDKMSQQWYNALISVVGQRIMVPTSAYLLLLKK